MDASSITTLVAGGAIAFGVLGPAIGMGMIASKGLEAIGRNPEAENGVRNTMVLALAFVETLAIFTLVMALIVKFV